MYTQLDFSRFYSVDAAEQKEFCDALVSDLRQHGFARLVNHGSRRFFELPVDDKLKAPHPPTANPHRGYSAFGIENVSAVSRYNKSSATPLLKDMKESYDIGSQRDPLYNNIWPPPGVCDAFQPTFASFFEVCYRAQLAILEAIAIGLGLPRQSFAELHVDQTNELRLTHYPTVARDEFASSTRIAAHTDFGSITLLFQDSVGGLQAESPPGSGTFVDVASGGPHECILNVGDCLGKWTGLESVYHRVHLPEPRTGPGGECAMVDERYSIAYFGKPDRSASLRPMTGEAKEGAYMTAGEFQNMRIQGTY
ncbi:hypothetical protein MCOR07_007837 [Pyricularia oryzae]|nr:hypothetical protein MCOR26_001723 [Pyricularia oryzae]KAI6342487.1 hypothetical protein MCOR28_005364 [Pyricularia oryzae]KAI6470217.1 hypothetical protein MCOR15_001392 [Pyricularia oryzae]KAI6616030.1 hypothetical protein MCOR07_007837 [Pyricularia oryzae]